MHKHHVETHPPEIIITGRHVLVTEAMKNYASEKLEKLEKLAPRNSNVHVIMDIQKLDHRVDMLVHFNHLTIKVHASSEDMYHSIDKAYSKLTAKLKRFKDKLHEHQHKKVELEDVAEHVFESEFIDYSVVENEESTPYTPPKIIKTVTSPIKLLTNQEAAMKLELSDAPFLLFKCEETRRLRLMYRREDGNLGLIEAE